MTDAYDDHIVSAQDVCNNCLRLIRVERVDATRCGVAREFEATFERDRRHTSVDYGPADSVSEQKGVFCACGVEGARDRIWTAEDLSRERFKTLVQHLLGTLNQKGVTVRRRQTAAHALQAFDDGLTPDAALARGVDVGLATAVSTPDDPLTTLG